MQLCFSNEILGDQTWKVLATGRKVTEHTLGGLRLILRYCPKKAARDVHSQDKAVEQSQKALKTGSQGHGPEWALSEGQAGWGEFRQSRDCQG